MPHGMEVSHVHGQKQGLLHCISHIPSCIPLEVSNGSILKERSSIHLYSWGPDRGCNLVVNPFISLGGWSCLHCTGLLGHLLVLNLSGGGGWFFSPSIAFFPLSSIFLYWLAGSTRRGWVSGGVGSLVWGVFLGTSLPGWDSSKSKRLTFSSFESPSRSIKEQLLQNGWIEGGTTGRAHQLMSRETEAG